MHPSRELSVLVVEDSTEVALLIRTALKRGGVRATLHVVEDGVEAVKYLSGVVDQPFGFRLLFCAT